MSDGVDVGMVVGVGIEVVCWAVKRGECDI